MKPEQIRLSDWHRILVGEVPPVFFVELVIRAAVIYLILMVSMRTMGKRMSSQLSRNEMAAMVSLAAAIGVPMMAPDRGLLPAIVIALVLILVERVIAVWTFRNQSFEKFSQGNISTMVKDGVIDVGVLESTNLSRERVIAQLRSSGVEQLGIVKRLYMEANGSFTLIKNEKSLPGLPTIPSWDKSLEECFEYADDTMVCCFCAAPQKPPFDKKAKCPNCGKHEWIAGVKSIKF
jgi:uncharacterized membrane protein YcaP (DUF421 family)